MSEPLRLLLAAIGIPRLLGLALGSTYAGIVGVVDRSGARYSPVINLGALLLGGILTLMTIVGVVIAAKRREDVSGLERALTASEHTANAWKGERDAMEEKVDRLTETLEHEREEQRELRHGLKDQLATKAAQLELERQKHDIGVVLEAMAETQRAILAQMGKTSADALAAVLDAQTRSEERMHELVREIVAEQRGLVDELKAATSRVAEAGPSDA